MRKTIFIAVIVGFLVLMLGVGFFILSNKSSQQPSASNGTSSTSTQGLPNVVVHGRGTGSSITPPLRISIKDIYGVVYRVKDFIHDPSTVPDPNNAGHYYLAGLFTVTNQNPAFSVVYVEADQSFNISIWQEPIAAQRQTAEQLIVKKLGITQQMACRLNYTVLVSHDISPTYSGKNLGFSFCPGATKLP